MTHESGTGRGPSTRTIDFSDVPDHRMHASGRLRDDVPDMRPRSSTGKLLTPKQIRARARRRMARAQPDALTEEEFNAYYKPMEEWDNEELARGRPRNPKGTFSGPKPKWINAQVHEQSMERFKAVIKTELNAQTVTAIDVLNFLMNNDDTDVKGRSVIPPTVKLQAAQFLLEHVVGKPKQHVQTDVSVKLQGLLASVIVNPNQALAPGAQEGDSPALDQPAYTPAHTPGITYPGSTEDLTPLHEVGTSTGWEGIFDGEVLEDD